MVADSHIVTTVAFEMSAAKKSPSTNVARSATSPSRATCREISTSAMIDFDPDAARAVLLRREHHDPPVSRSQVVDDVVFRDAREPEHRIGERLRRHREVDVRRLLRWRLHHNPENGQCGQHERDHALKSTPAAAV